MCPRNQRGPPSGSARRSPRPPLSCPTRTRRTRLRSGDAAHRCTQRYTPTRRSIYSSCGEQGACKRQRPGCLPGCDTSAVERVRRRTFLFLFSFFLLNFLAKRWLRRNFGSSCSVARVGDDRMTQTQACEHSCACHEHRTRRASGASKCTYATRRVVTVVLRLLDAVLVGLDRVVAGGVVLLLDHFDVAGFLVEELRLSAAAARTALTSDRARRQLATKTIGFQCMGKEMSL